MASFKNPPPRRLRGIVHYLLLLFQPGGGGDDYGSRCSLCCGRLNEVLMRSISRAVSSFAIVSSVRFSEPLRRRDTYCCVQPILSASAFCVSPVSCIFSRTRSAISCEYLSHWRFLIRHSPDAFHPPRVGV